MNSLSEAFETLGECFDSISECFEDADKAGDHRDADRAIAKAQVVATSSVALAIVMSMQSSEEVRVAEDG